MHALFDISGRNVTQRSTPCMPLNDDWTKGYLAVPAAVLFPQHSYVRL